MNVLAKLKRKGIALAVASNIPSLFLREHLQSNSLEKYFSAVVGQEDCDEKKPSPKPILLALEKMGSKPESSAYVGDMEEDIIAAKRANVYPIAVSRQRSYHPTWKLTRQNPSLVVLNLTDLLAIFDGYQESQPIPLCQPEKSQPDSC